MTHASPVSTRPGDGLLRAGVVVFAIGLVAVLTCLVLFLTGTDEVPLPLVLVASLLPVGLGLALLGLLRGLLASRRS